MHPPNTLPHFSEIVINVVSVNGLGFTLCVRVNLIIKFIYVFSKCKCLIFIYVCVSVNVEHDTCKCKIMQIYFMSV